MAGLQPTRKEQAGYRSEESEHGEDFGSSEDDAVEDWSGTGSGRHRPAAAVNAFPTREFYLLIEGLNKVPYQVFPHHLDTCLRAALDIEARPGRLAASDRDQLLVRRLLRDALPSACDKCLDDSALQRWGTGVHLNIYRALLSLLDLTLKRLEGRVAGGAAQRALAEGGVDFGEGDEEDEEVEEEAEDMVQLLQALGMALDPASEFHHKHRNEPLPDGVTHYAPLLYSIEPIVPSAPHASGGSSSSSDSGAATGGGSGPTSPLPTLRDAPRQWQRMQHLWLVNLLEHLGRFEAMGGANGFQLLGQALQEAGAGPRPGRRISLAHAELLLQLLAQTSHLLLPSALQPLEEGVAALLSYVGSCVERDLEALASNGRDRVFQTLSNVLLRAYTLLAAAGDAGMADAAVSTVQRQLVLQLLDSPNFNKHLAAVRETNFMLHRARTLEELDGGCSARAAVEWLRSTGVVQRLLRAHLHQRQYVDQVQKVLKFLTAQGGLQQEHLDLLWNVTEKAGTFEAVKSNVLCMLGELAEDLGPQQLDTLFTRFEAAKGWPTPERLQLLDLMRRFAASDEHAVMADRVLRLLWEVVMAPNAPAEVLQCGALQEVVARYDAVAGRRYSDDYSRRCVDMIRQDCNVLAALSMLKELVAALGSRSATQHKTAQQANATDGQAAAAVVEALEEQHGVVDLVLSNLQQTLERSRSHLMASTSAPSVDGTASSGKGPPSLAAEEEAAHAAAVRAFADFLLYVASNGRPFEWAQIDRLWAALVLSPVLPSDAEVGMLAAKDMLAAGALAGDAAERLLTQRVTALAPEALSPTAYLLFLEFFRHVNCAEGRAATDEGRELMRVADAALAGLDYFWRIVLDGPPAIFPYAHIILVRCYTTLAPPLALQPGTMRAAFLRRCLDALYAAGQRLNVAQLRGVFASPVPAAGAGAGQGEPALAEPGEQAVAERHVERCLQLLHDMLVHCQGRTMPLLPSHAASFQGSALRLEVQAVGSHAAGSRFTVEVARNSYVGGLRARVARLLGSQMQFVRLLCGGFELNNDALLLSGCGVTLADGTYVTATVSPLANAFSCPEAAEVEAEAAASPTRLLVEMGVYGPLLQLADYGPTPEARRHAGRLLDLLPTHASVTADLRAALAPDAQRSALIALLHGGAAEGQSPPPARLLYTVQALSSLLFPVSSSGGGSSDADARTTDSGDAAAVALVLSFVQLGGVETLLHGLHALQGKPTHDLEVTRALHTVVQQLLSRLANCIVGMLNHYRCQQTQQAQQAAGAANAEAAPGDTPSPATAAVLSNTVSLYQILTNMLLYNVRLAWSAGRGWGVYDTAEQSSAVACALMMSAATAMEADGQLSLDALQAMRRLLEKCPELGAVLLRPAGECSALMVQLLLNGWHERVRRTVGQLLTWQAAGSAELNEAVLRLLAGNIGGADERPQHCIEYYGVLQATLANTSEGSDSQRMLADKVLQLLVAGLRGCFDAAAAAAAATGACGCEGDYRLEGKLRCCATCLRHLHAPALLEGGAGGAGAQLLSWLLDNMLFPEASYLASLHDDDPLQPAHVEAVITAACAASRGARAVGLEVAGELMARCAALADVGGRTLMALHYSGERLRDWEVQPQAPARGRRYVGMKNGGATCYMNAVVQQLFMQPDIRARVLSHVEEPQQLRADSVLYQLQVLFGHLALSRSDLFVPRGFWRSFKDYDGQPVSLREHQDAYEFFTRLQDSVDSAMLCVKESPAMQSRLGGKFAQQIICEREGFRSEREEAFVAISVDVRGKRGLLDSLQAYVSGELMEGENQYLCEEIGKKVDAVKRNCIKQLPDTLLVHLKRFEFDYETMTRWKVRDRFEFPLTLDMWPYTVEGLAAQEAGNAAAAPATSAATGGESGEGGRYAYALKGVVVHSGTAFAGHYYSYIKTREGDTSLGSGRGPLLAGGEWYCFDDASVESWDVSHLERDCYGGRQAVEVTDGVQPVVQELYRPNSAYMLVYERVSAPAARVAVAAAALAPQPLQQQGVDAVKEVGTTQQEAGASGIPYNMPRSIYESVMYENLEQLDELHLLDRDCFRLMRQVVAAAAARLAAGGRKMRRRDAPLDAQAVEGGGGMSAVRGEDSEREAAAAMQLAAAFLFKVYLHASKALRQEVGGWEGTLRDLCEASPTATTLLLLQLAHGSAPGGAQGGGGFVRNLWLKKCLLLCPTEQVRQFTGRVVLMALQQASSTPGCEPGFQEPVQVMLRTLLDLATGQWSAKAQVGELFDVLTSYACRPEHRAALGALAGEGLLRRLLEAALRAGQRWARGEAGFLELVNAVRCLGTVAQRLDLSPFLPREGTQAGAEAHEEWEQGSNPYMLQPPLRCSRDEFDAVTSPRMMQLLLSDCISSEEVQQLLLFLCWGCTPATLSAADVLLTLLARPSPQAQAHELLAPWARCAVVADSLQAPRLRYVLMGPQHEGAGGAGVLPLLEAVTGADDASRRWLLLRYVTLCAAQSGAADSIVRQTLVEFGLPRWAVHVDWLAELLQSVHVAGEEGGGGNLAHADFRATLVAARALLEPAAT